MIPSDLGIWRPAQSSLLLITLATALSLSNAAQAGQMTLADLQKLCVAPDVGSRNACRFYILGVTEGSSTAAGFAGDKEHFCIPEGLSADSLELLVKGSIGQDLMVFPQDRSMPAVSFVAATLVTSFPCAKAK